jgi:hypothetical protein
MIREIDFLTAARGWINRVRFFYLPLALLLPAVGIAIFTTGWTWSWLVTLFGCLPGLIGLAITTNENLGVGIVVSITVYLVIAGVVTGWRYRRRDSSRPTTSLEST